MYVINSNGFWIVDQIEGDHLTWTILLAHLGKSCEDLSLSLARLGGIYSQHLIIKKKHILQTCPSSSSQTHLLNSQFTSYSSDFLDLKTFGIINLFGKCAYQLLLDV